MDTIIRMIKNSSTEKHKFLFAAIVEEELMVS